ncbi:alpha-1,2-fucosyltransferase [Spirosoma sp. KNUC1025]|uniref:alpha-1,2-fucosyltransferase n=1 Tax=Spirosoma sp. KNUC1025 TaxID=2894082 RepID=UPI003870157B|nr:alpha-1,2-fucosyltransferase [Spirosoma sp. KNUC1025]
MITFSNLGKPEWGRLGNQLFQIAATLGIASQNKQEVAFPKWAYSEYFVKPLEVGYCNDCQKYTQKDYKYKFVGLPVGNWDLCGFFQSEKFFLHIEADIRRQFAPSPDVLSYINQKYGHLLTKKTCSLHVRRGDYLKLNAAFPVQPLTYYFHAISHFPPDTHFLVFSDDISWCKTKFQGSMFSFVENEKDIIDLIIMSLCQHNIISNSSFSWWGAWLNSNPDKVVLCPAWWFGPAASMRPKYRAHDIYARGFKALTLPGEKTWLINMYNFITSPFYKIYYKSFEVKQKLIKNKFIKRMIYKIKSVKT